MCILVGQLYVHKGTYIRVSTIDLVCVYSDQGTNRMNVQLVKEDAGRDVWISQALIDAGLATVPPAVKPVTYGEADKPCSYLPG